MSLRGKKVDFELLYSQLEINLELLYELTSIPSTSSSTVISGIKLYQIVYDLCTAHPTPHTDMLISRLKLFLIKVADLIYNVCHKFFVSNH